ncbi:MAG: pyrroline-5-carboxylate reductase [Proteobacteria bacterium]|nr:pyrroline-5-carboxylate reductase [Pseudomonadota bacterium]NLN63135.1 pyrroline-5-carboxylate reductase [Myxococcales bacterium]
MKIGILGCGQMGEIILKGLLSLSFQSIEDIYATTLLKDHVRELENRYPGLKVTRDNLVAAKNSNVLILSVQPSNAQEVLSSIREELRGKLLISICTGVTLAQLEEWANAPGQSGQVEIVRAMPNTPCVIGEGTIVLTARPEVSDETMTRARSLFEQLGRTHVLDERHFDVVTALSAAGPAFAFMILEALADGAVMMGLPRQEAREISAQMFQGAARLLLQSARHPAALKDEVTTPGGCTIAGLLIMEEGRIRSTLAKTIQEATTVASRLGQDCDTCRLDQY